MCILISNYPVADNIKRIIENKGLKKATISKMVGYSSPQKLSDMIHGRKIIKVDDIVKLKYALDVSYDELFSEGK